MRGILIEKYQQPSFDSRNGCYTMSWIAWHNSDGEPDRKNNLPAVILIEGEEPKTSFYCRSGIVYKEIMEMEGGILITENPYSMDSPAAFNDVVNEGFDPNFD